MRGLADGISKSKKYVEKAVSGVAETMKLTMQSNLSYRLDGASAAVVGSTGGASVVNNYYNNDNSRTVNQTNNSPKALSRLGVWIYGDVVKGEITNLLFQILIHMHICLQACHRLKYEDK